MDQPLKFGFIPTEDGSYYPESLGEAIRLIKLLWEQEEVNFAGKHDQVPGLKIEPRPMPHRFLMNEIKYLAKEALPEFQRVTP